MDAATLAEGVACPQCRAPAGSPCRTGRGTVAAVYHPQRQVLRPELGSVGSIAVPADRRASRRGSPSVPVLLGYAYSSVTAVDLTEQAAALRSAGCVRVFTDTVGISVATRPALAEAVRFGRAQRASASGQRVILVVNEVWGLARHSRELIRVVADLCAAGLGLRILTGTLAGRHESDRSALFAALGAAAELDRRYWADRSRAAVRDAADEGRVGGRPRVLDDAMRQLARAWHGEGVSVPEIARRLTTPAGRHPSVASVYRVLAEPPAEPDRVEVA